MSTLLAIDDLQWCDTGTPRLASGVDADAEVMRWPAVPPMLSFCDPDRNRLYVVENNL